MSLENANLRRLRVYVEPSGSYATDNTGTPGDFEDLPWIEGTLTAEQNRALLPQSLAKPVLDAHSEALWGPKSNTVGFSSYLVSHGQDLDGDVTPTASGSIGFFDMFEAFMGGRQDTTNVAAQTEVTGSPSSTVFDVTASHGARFTPGAAVGIVIGGALEVREILSVATDTITVKEAFSAAPSVSDVVRGSVTMYMGENGSTSDTSLQFLVQGREGSDEFGYFGCQLTGLTFQFGLGELIQCAFQFAGAGWTGPGSGVTLASTDLSMYSDPIAAFPLTLHVPTLGSTSIVNICPFDTVELSPAISWAPVTCGSATDNISQMIRQRAADALVSGSFTTSFEDSTWYDAWENSTDHAVFLQAGSTVGSTVMFSCPTVQIVNVQEATVSGDLRGQKVDFRARTDSEISSPSSELEYSAFRIHFL